MAKVTIANLNTLLDTVVTSNIAVQTAQSAVTNATVQADNAATSAQAAALSKSQIDQQVIVIDGLADDINADVLAATVIKDAILALEEAIRLDADQVTLDRTAVTTMLGEVLTAKSGVDVKAELIEEMVEDFHTKYLGASSTEPTVSWGGMELATGMLYFDTVKERLMIWLDSNKWEPANEVVGALYAANNLSDVSDVVMARTNLDVMSTSEVEAQIQADITAIKGQPLGLAELDAAGLVPVSQLPSYVDDVIEVATYADLPVIGESGKIYIVVADETSNGDTSSYRWTGTAYARVSNSLTAADVKLLYESNADTNAYTDAEQVKVGHITITQAVDLDTIESDTILNNSHRTSNGTDHTYIDQDVTTTATPTFAGIITSGLVDGRDVSVDGLKLDGIEVGATADQTKIDIDALGIDAATVNGLTVETAVPLGAVFTDTYVSGATLDTMTSILTITGTNGVADVEVDLSDFVNSAEIANYYTIAESDLQHAALANTSVGQSVSYFLGDTVVTGDNYELTSFPDGGIETTIAKVAVLADTPYFMERYISSPLGGTKVDGGVWLFRTYATVNSTVGVSEIVARINKRSIKSGTITITGTGITRTVTSTDAIFVAGDANTSILNASLIETPTDTFWISNYISPTQVTVTLSVDTYVNETAVPIHMYYKLFEVSTGEINSTTPILYETKTIQPEFTILPTDSVLIAYFARTTSTNKTLTLYKGGTTNYSHIVTPLVVRHNSLQGLNDGEYQHLTQAQLEVLNEVSTHLLDTSVHGVTEVVGMIETQTLTNKTIDNISNLIGADHIHYKVRNASGSTIAINTVVTASGTQPGTDYVQVIPVTDPQTQIALGITHTELLNNGIGLVMNTGVHNNANTSAWTVGTLLYPNITGGLTSTKPTSGRYQACAVVLRQHSSSGTLLCEFTEPKLFASTTQAGYVQLNNTLTSTSVTEALTSAQGKVLRDILVASNIDRADKYLAAQNIANMIYVGDNLTKIQYNTATDVNYEVLTYGVDGLSNIAHYINSILTGNTVLTYTAGDLTSAVYTGV